MKINRFDIVSLENCDGTYLEQDNCSNGIYCYYDDVAELESENLEMRCCGNCNNWTAMKEFCHEKQDRYAGDGICEAWELAKTRKADCK